MNNYNNNIIDKDFCCAKHLLSNILNNLCIGDDKYKSITIVADEYLTQELLKLILRLGVDFSFITCNYDSLDYDDLYYITLTNDMEIYCEKAWHDDNEYHKAGYLYTEDDIIYIQADVNSKILRKLDNGNNHIVIYDIED